MEHFERGSDFKLRDFLSVCGHERRRAVSEQYESCCDFRFLLRSVMEYDRRRRVPRSSNRHID